LTGWLLTSIQFLATRGFVEIPAITKTGWQSVWFLGICSTGIAYIFWFDSLEEITAAQAGAFLYLESLFTSVFASIVLDEHFFLNMNFG
jgi:drug/metabolite transporter (DMT)-like permease